MTDLVDGEMVVAKEEDRWERYARVMNMNVEAAKVVTATTTTEPEEEKEDRWERYARLNGIV